MSSLRFLKAFPVFASILFIQTAVFADETFSRFVGIKNFSSFSKSTAENGDIMLLSENMDARIPWNELIVSWNVNAPTGTFVKIEASAIFKNREEKTKFYTVANWSPDNEKFPRTSVRGQKDADGNVETDTLVVNQPAIGTQLRITLGGEGKIKPQLKFLGLSFANTTVPMPSLPANRSAWGKIVTTPEKSQNAYPDEQGWCSPTSLSMVLCRWSDVLHRPEMKLDVPEIATAVYDAGWHASGNWPFNTAFAGSFNKMRSYVTRFDDISELEDWIAAGIPVVISGPWNLLEDGRKSTGSGHLTVCVGFDEKGDVYINDPGTRVGASVRHLYKRENVLKSWAKSHHTVYLVYPENAKIPKDRFGHWEKK